MRKAELEVKQASAFTQPLIYCFELAFFLISVLLFPRFKTSNGNSDCYHRAVAKTKVEYRDLG